MYALILHAGVHLLIAIICALIFFISATFSSFSLVSASALRKSRRSKNYIKQHEKVKEKDRQCSQVLISGHLHFNSLHRVLVIFF